MFTYTFSITVDSVIFVGTNFCRLKKTNMFLDLKFRGFDYIQVHKNFSFVDF